MRLEIEVLDGNHKGQKISLVHGLLLGRQTNQLYFSDDLISEQHGTIILDHKSSWNIKCLHENLVRVGYSEVPQITLIKGLIFHLGQTGFRVTEKASPQITSWTEGLISWLKENPAKQAESASFFFYLRPIRLTFAQGPQYGEFLTVSYGPRHLGYNSLDLNLVDPSLPKNVAHFFQIGEQAYIENLCDHKATINANSFDQHPIQDADLLKIGSTIIELSILK